MVLIDSSGWLEYFTEGPLSNEYAIHLKHLHEVLTPTIVLYEVYKVIKRQRGEEAALSAVAQMGKSRLIPLNDTIALTAADASLSYQLAMADAIVYATALTHRAKLLTHDADLAALPGVVYLKK